MTDELDDTRPALERRSGRAPASVENVPVEHVLVENLGDTVMSITSIAQLVEPSLPASNSAAVDRAIAATVGPPARAQPVRHYSFRMGQSLEAIMLDRPARIGREPATTRISTGIIPRLVRVPSPSHEVSATHVELRQVGSSVIVTDLRSTNGSVVMQPGSLPRKLSQGESVVVSPGTLVDIGDENILEILPMQRLG